MRTLYDKLQEHDNWSRYDEAFVTSLVIENGVFRGCTAIQLKTGSLVFFRAKAGIIATGGAGQIWKFTATSVSTTGDGIGLAYRAGLPIEDMEFMQFHPTGLSPVGGPHHRGGERRRRLPGELEGGAVHAALRTFRRWSWRPGTSSPGR